MTPGEKVLLFTASGTFRGHAGHVVQALPDGAWVRVDGHAAPMRFDTGEIVRDRESHVGGAE